VNAKESALFFYTANEMKYHFYEGHPFNQHRLKLTVDLLQRAGALPQDIICTPDHATDEELALVHSLTYIQAVRTLSELDIAEEWLKKAESFGLDLQGDTPYFEGMHEVSSQIVGGTLAAVEAVMSGKLSMLFILAAGYIMQCPVKALVFAFIMMQLQPLLPFKINIMLESCT
jgi:acetoin utilization protein AcuC